MKLVYTAPTMFMVAHMRNLLATEGIASTVRNEFIASGAGELPPTECWPELWVVHDEQAGRAGALIAEATHNDGPEDQASWQCPLCGESIEGNFGQCWKCGALRQE